LKRTAGPGLLKILKSELLKKPEQVAHESQVETLTAKVKMRGPISRRDLSRSYHRMPASELDVLLSSAMEAGLLREEEGLIRAVQVGECSN